MKKFQNVFLLLIVSALILAACAPATPGPDVTIKATATASGETMAMTNPESVPVDVNFSWSQIPKYDSNDWDSVASPTEVCGGWKVGLVKNETQIGFEHESRFFGYVHQSEINFSQGASSAHPVKFDQMSGSNMVGVGLNGVAIKLYLHRTADGDLIIACSN